MDIDEKDPDIKEVIDTMIKIHGQTKISQIMKDIRGEDGEYVEVDSLIQHLDREAKLWDTTSRKTGRGEFSMGDMHGASKYQSQLLPPEVKPGFGFGEDDDSDKWSKRAPGQYKKKLRRR